MVEEKKSHKSESDTMDDLIKMTNIQEIKDYYEYTENCMRVIADLEVPKISEIDHLRFNLPEKLLKKKLAIFDLDETLIHCELKNPQKAEKMINIKLLNGDKAKVCLFLYIIILLLFYLYLYFCY